MSTSNLSEEIRTLLIEADSALSLIFYRFGSRLTDIENGQFKDHVGRLINETSQCL